VSDVCSGKAIVANHLNLAVICFLRMFEGKNYGLTEGKNKENALEA
jgi:hypothetical protein